MKNKHLLLWSSLGALCLLLLAAVQENFFKEWRQIQASVQTEAGPLEVRLRQVVAPKLQVTDRCVSCHVGMAPGEQGATGLPVAGAHPPVGHDPAEFGCTVCHGGQGRATEKADAHGDVPFWPEPMLPGKYAYAGCGSCHTHIQVPGVAQLTRGRNLLEQHDCLACHRLDGRGGTLRPGGVGGMEGPDLSRAGQTGYDARWYQKHLERSKQAADGLWKRAFRTIDPDQRRAIEAFLASRVGAPRLVEAKALFNTLGCRGCHKVSGVGGVDGPELTGIGRRDPARLDFTHVEGEHTLANWLSAHTRDPALIVPGSKMPKFDLGESQVDLLTYYLLSLRQSDVSEAFWPKDRVQVVRLGQREFGTDGATLFGTFCSGCHGPRGQGQRFPGTTPFPAIGNADFLAVADNAFLGETIRRGRPGRRMPAWGDPASGLGGEEIDAIVAHLRTAAEVPEPKPTHDKPRWVTGDAKRGQALFTQHCAGCHGPRGEGTDAPAINNPVLLSSASDDYFVETIGRGRRGTAMNGFRNPSTVYPSLAPAEIESIVAYFRTWETQK